MTFLAISIPTRDLSEFCLPLPCPTLVPAIRPLSLATTFCRWASLPAAARPVKREEGCIVCTLFTVRTVFSLLSMRFLFSLHEYSWDILSGHIAYWSPAHMERAWYILYLASYVCWQLWTNVHDKEFLAHCVLICVTILCNTQRLIHLLKYKLESSMLQLACISEEVCISKCQMIQKTLSKRWKLITGKQRQVFCQAPRGQHVFKWKEINYQQTIPFRRSPLAIGVP